MNNIKNNELISLAIPTTIEHTLQTLVGFIDAFLVAKIGLTAVSAVGIANAILNVYLALFIALGVASSSLVAQKLGGRKIEDAKLFATQSTVVSIVIGIIFSLISVCFSKSLLSLMGATDKVLHYAHTFFFLVGGSSIFISLMTIFSSILRATKDTKTPMKISFIVNILNILFDYILIFGCGPIPPLGILGTAIGTVLSRIIGCFLLFKKVQTSICPINLKLFSIDSSLNSLLSLAMPATIERLVMRIGQVAYFSLIVSISSKVFASHSITGNIEAFTYMPAYGLAAAASTVVAFAVGANNFEEARYYARLANQYGVIIMSILGGILYFGSPIFARLFTQDVEAINQIVTALRIDAFAQPALAISIITTGSLQGMGDTKSPLYSTAIGIWFIRLLGILILSKWLQLGIAGIWISILIDLYLRSIYLVRKFNKNIIALQKQFP